MRLGDFIALAARIEDKVAEIYELFASRFEDPEVGYFWRLAAATERYHAASIRLHVLTVDVEQEVEPEVLPVEVPAARDFLQRLEGLLEELRARDFDLAYALDTAIDIESNGSEVHGRTQFSYLYPELGALFEQLEAEDRAHRESFLAARQRFLGS